MVSGRFSYSRLLLSLNRRLVDKSQEEGAEDQHSTCVILTQFLYWYTGRFGRRVILEVLRRVILEVLRTYNIRQRMSLSRLGRR
jgi:hypothetical protein